MSFLSWSLESVAFSFENSTRSTASQLQLEYRRWTLLQEKKRSSKSQITTFQCNSRM